MLTTFLWDYGMLDYQEDSTPPFSHNFKLEPGHLLKEIQYVQFWHYHIAQNATFLP